jgi:hypothetical protein
VETVFDQSELNVLPGRSARGSLAERNVACPEIRKEMSCTCISLGGLPKGFLR